MDIDSEPIDKKIPKATKRKHKKEGAGSPISFPQTLNDDEWVLRRQDIQMKATALIMPVCPNFKFSNCWVFMFVTPCH